MKKGAPKRSRKYKKMSSIGKITGTVCRLTHNNGIKRLSLLHLSELRGKDSVDDLHDELDRASAEGFSTGYTHAGSHAQRGVDSAADG